MKKIIYAVWLVCYTAISYSQCAGDLSFVLSVPPNPDNTYPPGTITELCVVQTGWNGNSQISNWFEGFGLALGEGWESVVPVSQPTDADEMSGTWLWVETVTSDATGMTAGPGYFFEGPTGPTDGNPGNDWGDYCMTGDCVWNFCVSLTVANVGDPLDLAIGVTSYADGSMGSWGNELCFDPEFPIFVGTIGCLTTGCTDPAACNFDVLAGCDNGSCEYFSIGDITHDLLPCPDTVCIGSRVSYAVAGNQISAYNWNLTGGGLLTADQTSNSEILWGETPGTYTITVQEITPQGCESTLKVCNVELMVPEIQFPNSYRICYNQSANLNAFPPGGSWSGDYVNGNVFVGSTPGVYWPTYVTNIYGCSVSKSIDVTVDPLYQAPDISYTKQELDLCLDSPSQRYIADDDRSSYYFWSVDKTPYPNYENILNIEWRDTTGLYLIEVYGIDVLGCQSETQAVNVSATSCQRVYAPNSFTPNGDGINDVFKIATMSVHNIKLTIFNRWGAPIYESSSLYWTGDTGSGYYAPTDTYNWVVQYQDQNGFNREQQGAVVLIR